MPRHQVYLDGVNVPGWLAEALATLGGEAVHQVATLTAAGLPVAVAQLATARMELADLAHDPRHDLEAPLFMDLADAIGEIERNPNHHTTNHRTVLSHPLPSANLRNIKHSPPEPLP